jgi:hypothetical protein
MKHFAATIFTPRGDILLGCGRGRPNMMFHQLVVNLPITGYTGGSKSDVYYDKLYELYLETRRLDSGSTAVVQFAELPRDHFCYHASQQTMRERVYACGLSIVMEEEAADWQGCKIVRCPTCCQMHPAGFYLCLYCGAGWTYRAQEDPMAINSAAAPINVDIDKRSKLTGKTLAFGGRTAGVRSGPASFWKYVEDCLRWNKMWWPRTLEVQADLARQGYSPTISGKDQVEVWAPRSRMDGGPTHEDIVTWQMANKTAEVATYTTQVLSVLPEVRRTNRATIDPPGSNPKVLKEHRAEICKAVLGRENPFEETDDAAAPKAISVVVAKATVGVQRRELIVGQAAQQGLDDSRAARCGC